MKKWWAITGLLLLISGAVWANNVTINATVLPADANILFDSYQWNIPLVNDGATPYQNDQQGVMTVKSGSTWIFHIQFSSANLGYVKQGTDKIAYYVKVTELADSYGGIIMSSDIMNGYVQLTSSKTIQFIGKTSKNGARFAVGIKVNALAGQFYESGVYTDTMTVTFFVF
ncbi:MAG TPA: hypothetical protein PKK71_00835 [Rectinema sp.]|jgi:hypothetical protein|nr:hypothetical protein [Rectinema sp.]HOH17207.1 hypothetical protein [Rectinema sp.]HQO44942.1 hypothetical protein [Rectinema sp.]HQQ72189.1 hypothetical protein [Rectinema sp.]